MKTKKNGATRPNFYNQSVNRLIVDSPMGSTMGKKKGEPLLRKMTNQWTYFELSYAPIKVAYTIQNNALKVVLKTGVPKGYYYSFLNDAIEQAREHFNSSHTHLEINNTGEILTI